MIPEKRSVIAYIAAISTGKKVNSVYDYGRNKYCYYINNGNSQNISVFDSERNCFVGGTLPNLFDYGSNTIFSLILNSGNFFTGFDYQTAEMFSINVYNTMVSVFSNGQYYNYLIV